MATSPDQNNTQPQVVDNTDPGYTTPAAMDYISLTPTSSRIANIDPNIFREVTSQEYVNAQKNQYITR